MRYLLLALLLFSSGGRAAPPAAPPVPWFNRVCTHYGELDEKFIDYALQVRPQVVMAGHFGPGYYSALPYAARKGVPVYWTSLGGGPVEPGWWRGQIARAHGAGIKVLGLFSLTLVYGDAEKGEGWFAWYDREWDAGRLGERPGVPGTRAVDLMQLTPDGKPAREENYRIEGGGEYHGCPSNPLWREVLKRMVRAGIEQGLDGYTIIFPHRESCSCRHCQLSFRAYLKARFTPAQLRQNFGIADLETHQFPTIYGWYEDADASPLRHAMLQWTQLTLDECKREVFMDFGRRLKPDLMVGQWNHIYRSSMSGPGQLAGTFAQLNADERSTLPTELWARDENFVLYSIGNWSMYWKPEEKHWAQFSLEHKYLRAAGRGLPHAVKRDDNRNVRLYIAEAVAHGGYAYARGPDYRDAPTREIVRQYFDFLRRHEHLYRPLESAGQVALVFPRSAVHRGDKGSLADFKNLGMLLTQSHVPFDVLVDDMPTPRPGRYHTVLRPQSGRLTEAGTPELQQAMRDSVVDAGPEVIATLWRQPALRGTVLHLVNYARDPDLSRADVPVPSGPLKVQLRLQPGEKVRRVRLLSPDEKGEVRLPHRRAGNLLTFTIPRLVVYSIAVVEG